MKRSELPVKVRVSHTPCGAGHVMPCPQVFPKPFTTAVSKWDIIVLSFAPTLRRTTTCFVIVTIGFLVLAAAACRPI